MDGVRLPAHPPRPHLTGLVAVGTASDRLCADLGSTDRGEVDVESAGRRFRCRRWVLDLPDRASQGVTARTPGVRAGAALTTGPPGGRLTPAGGAALNPATARPMERA
jgi:hypothetical protein